MPAKGPLEIFKTRLKQTRHQGWILAGLVLVKLYEAGFYRFFQQQIMIVTTTGRKSGLPRSVPVGFVEVGNYIYGVSRRTPKLANWVLNILEESRATLQIGQRVLVTRAEVLEEPHQTRQIIRLFLKRLPRYTNFFKVSLNSRDEEFDEVAKTWVAVRFEIAPTARKVRKTANNSPQSRK